MIYLIKIRQRYSRYTERLLTPVSLSEPFPTSRPSRPTIRDAPQSPVVPYPYSRSDRTPTVGPVLSVHRRTPQGLPVRPLGPGKGRNGDGGLTVIRSKEGPGDKKSRHCARRREQYGRRVPTPLLFFYVPSFPQYLISHSTYTLFTTTVVGGRRSVTIDPLRQEGDCCVSVPLYRGPRDPSGLEGAPVGPLSS